MQFSMRSLMLAIAFVAVTTAGAMTIYNDITQSDWQVIGLVTVVCAPLWVPVLFVAYALGRRALTVPSVIAFGLAQAVAVGVAWFATS